MNSACQEATGLIEALRRQVAPLGDDADRFGILLAEPAQRAHHEFFADAASLYLACHSHESNTAPAFIVLKVARDVTCRLPIQVRYEDLLGIAFAAFPYPGDVKLTAPFGWKTRIDRKARLELAGTGNVFQGAHFIRAAWANVGCIDC